MSRSGACVGMQGASHRPCSGTYADTDGSTACLQLGFLGAVLDWLAEEQASHKSALSGMLDLSCIGTAGHSRGAKLAALHFAGKQSASLDDASHYFHHQVRSEPLGVLGVVHANPLQEGCQLAIVSSTS